MLLNHKITKPIAYLGVLSLFSPQIQWIQYQIQ